MKFVMSYSCGKDSTLALDSMLTAGHQPVALLIMMNEKEKRSYFHGADESLIEQYRKALDLPVILCPSEGETYHLEFEKGLEKAKELGAETVCFGDIDLDSNRAWGEERCKNVGLKSEYPLWQRDRRDIVRELLASGYQCLIKAVNHTLLPKELLGELVSRKTLEIMGAQGIDICGENGEYHTMTIDGPIFHFPIQYETGNILDFDDYSIIEIK